MTQGTYGREDNCKGCRSSVRFSEAEIRRIVEETTGDHNAVLVTHDEYLSRLSVCRECKSLSYGTTCTHCGCLVAVRAWLADKHCPKPFDSKW